MEQDFYFELATARQELIDKTNSMIWDADFRVKVENIVILIDQLLTIKP